MTKEKRIEEMSQIITKVCETKKIIGSYKIAETIYAKGYRKASDVAREIFEEIEKVFIEYYGNANSNEGFIVTAMFGDVAELKKKYTEEGK